MQNRAPIVPRVLHSQSFALFLGVRSRFFYPPLLKILEMKEKGGEKEVSMFLRTKRAALRNRKRGREDVVFQHYAIERERERTIRERRIRILIFSFNY